MTPVFPYLSAIQDILESWRERGRLVLENGTEYLVPVSDEGVTGYVHALYAPAPKAWLEGVQKDLGVAMPGDLRLFYQIAGGASFFDGGVEIPGRRLPFHRPYPESDQPKDLFDYNPMASVEQGPEDCLVFAFQKREGVRYAFPYPDLSREVVAIGMDGSFLETWPHFWSWLLGVLDETGEVAAKIDEDPNPSLERQVILPTPSDILMPRPSRVEIEEIERQVGEAFDALEQGRREELLED